MPAVLTASGVHAGQPEVLTGIDLTLTEGDPPLGLIGPSGSGKTTLVHVLAGHIRPTRGRVTFDGQAITRRRGAGARDMRASVRFMSQDSLTVTDPRETVTGRLTQATKVARRAGRTHPLDPEELLAATGLPPQFLGRRTLTLSGGERQRLALATALATRPRILLLDEPLTALDPHARLAITRRLTQTVARLGIGVLLASHDLELIARMCPQAVFLSGGRLVERGPVGDLLGRSSHPVIRDLAEHTPFRG